jgi:hypothetical protein
MQILISLGVKIKHKAETTIFLSMVYVILFSTTVSLFKLASKKVEW